MIDENSFANNMQMYEENFEQKEFISKNGRLDIFSFEVRIK